VAFFAHIGGFVAGFVLVSFFKRRDVHILERAHHRPFELERRRGPWG
jgi:membrane associated rhomboid family serine protease